MEGEKTLVGLTEKIKINDQEYTAVIDTGAARSSIDLDLAIRLRLGPIVRKSTIISAHGKGVRPVIKVHISLAGRNINAFFNVVPRSHMRYRVLIGRNILKRSFLIDPSKTSQ